MTFIMSSSKYVIINDIPSGGCYWNGKLMKTIRKGIVCKQAQTDIPDELQHLSTTLLCSFIPLPKMATTTSPLRISMDPREMK